MVELKMDEFFSGRGLDGEREVKRMEERWKEIKKIIRAYEPDRAAVEELFFYKNQSIEPK